MKLLLGVLGLATGILLWKITGFILIGLCVGAYIYSFALTYKKEEK